MATVPPLEPTTPSEPGTRRRRHRTTPPRRRGVATVLGTIAALIALVATSFVVTTGRWHAATSTPEELTEIDGGDADVATVASLSHPVYRYSVIPGGAHDRQELIDAIRGDAVVANHYRAVSLDAVHVERLPVARRAYVSYRVGDKVYWTKHQVTLPAGEPILTDGTTQIRARCGNCISSEPQLPTSEQEPDAVEFDALAPALGDRPAGSRTAATVPAPFPLASAPRGGVVPADGVPSLSPSNLGPSAIPLLGAPGFGSSRPQVSLLSSDVPNPDQNNGVATDPGGNGDVPGRSMPAPVIPADLVTANHGTGDGPIPDEFIHGSSLPQPSGDDNPPPPNFQTDVPPQQPAPVPEPSTMLLLGTGVAGALYRRARARRKKGRSG